ncbi:MAG: hypothetical protein HY260_13220 [Chloroflexi bacterium]|nr:hypothetical protein [Chloroflexota bacterium]
MADSRWQIADGRFAWQIADGSDHQPSAISRQPPVIAISALGFREVVQQAVSAGAKDFVVKPFDVGALAGRVQRALDGRMKAGD